MFLIFDTETTGLPRDYNAPLSDGDNWPRLVQVAWQLHDATGALVEARDDVVVPEGFTIPFNATKVHGITEAVARKYGVPLAEALERFTEAVQQADFVVGHNVKFDLNIMGAEYYRLGQQNPLEQKAYLDTSRETRDFCQLKGGKGGGYKIPKLEELYEKLFGESFAEAHNAAADVEATARAFLEAVRRKIFSDDHLEWTSEQRAAFEAAQPDTVPLAGIEVKSFKELAAQLASEEAREPAPETPAEPQQGKAETPFSHLHVHTQFSILQATCPIPDLIEKAQKDGMPAVALTDHANLFGAFNFVKAATEAGLKPIVGSEFYLCQDRHDRSKKDNGHALVLLAKNKRGYQNLIKLSSYSYTEGFYYVPRIDRELLLQYKDDLIATTAGLRGEVPHLLLNVGEKQAEEAFAWYYEQFGDDFYVELNRHGLEEETAANEGLLKLARRYGVRYFAANDVYYQEEKDANAHDILLCVKEGEFQSTPIGRGRGYRFGFPNNEFYFKGQAAMKELFADLPEAIETTQAIVDKVEPFGLEREVLLPKFEIPAEFWDPQDEEDGGTRGENNYLRHLTYEGARQRYGEVDAALQQRLDFELETIAKTGYPGYFLIVQDFTSEARKMGVSVGPGRGSAAGSAVAYCIGITNVDPIKYDLLFERFLNPDRISMPDIDIDFDDEGRSRILDWVVDKYGSNQVAQIITYGTMAGKSAVRDAGRVLQLSLNDTDRVAKLVPDEKLGKIFSWSDQELREKLNSDAQNLVKQLKALREEDSPEAKVLNQARVLEGSVRNTGVHACGVIITPGDLTDYVPVATAKDSSLVITQFDNNVVEDAGLLKMDFLGLKNLSILNDAIALIEKRHGHKIVLDDIPLDDADTLALFARGETLATFQFESPGMQKHLRALQPDQFADLIAMNALYRPGPMEYIPDFIARKHGKQAITYDLPEMQEYLEETYGITVYQEQVMLLSQKLAGFSKGEADVLRKAMGKKKIHVLAKMKPQFIEQGVERGHPRETLDKIWKDWEAFASYAFNKSHSTCYSVIAFHTGYLKAHYPEEYMASMLTHKMNDIKELTKYMEECRRMGLTVLGPDINESEHNFTVNEEGQIRFGLSGMKGVGSKAVQSIVAERKESGPFTDLFDLLKRIDLRATNKRTLENLILGGAFDGFEGTHRALYFHTNGDDRTFLERALKYAQTLKAQEASAQASLFGGSEETSLPEPELPTVAPWGRMEELRHEKEVNGLYISSHPLDDYQYELKSLTTHTLGDLENLTQPRDFTVGGIVAEASHLTTRNNKPWGILRLEDYQGSFTFRLFGEDYLSLKPFLEKDMMLLLRGRINRYTPRYDGAEERIEAKVEKISLLQDVLEQQSRGVRLVMSIDTLRPEFIDYIDKFIKEHPGQKHLEIGFYDPEKKKLGVRLERPSCLNLSTPVLQELEKNTPGKLRLLS
ncbi:MAG: DNA polymerase III subunit alpha [Schleiferiaceae bacterium]|nr:DNA polymerase III subunit alpha [Schleiferiaceae bacterium]